MKITWILTLFTSIAVAIAPMTWEQFLLENSYEFQLGDDGKDCSAEVQIEKVSHDGIYTLIQFKAYQDPREHGCGFCEFSCEAKVLEKDRDHLIDTNCSCD